MIAIKRCIPNPEAVQKGLKKTILPNKLGKNVQNKTFIPTKNTVAELAKTDPFVGKPLQTKFNTQPYIQPMRKGTDPIIVKDSKHPFEPLKDYRGKPAVEPKEYRVAAGSPPPPPPGGNGGGGDKNNPNDIRNILNNLNKNLNKVNAKKGYNNKPLLMQEPYKSNIKKITYKPMEFKKGINEEINNQYNNLFKK